MMKNNISIDIEEDVLVDKLVDELVKPTKAIILYNDDHNSFPHVINCLRKYCKHSGEQAEQVAMIVHNVGKCDVKHGSLEELKPVHEALLENGLTSRIEE